eukprot:Gb_15858 [translate_table: standard]
MATPLLRCTLRRIIQPSGLRSRTISSSTTRILRPISTGQGEEQSSDPFDSSFAVCGEQKGSGSFQSVTTLFHKALWKRKFSAVASKDVSNEPKAEEKSEKKGKTGKRGKKKAEETVSDSELSDCARICKILNGDGALDELEAKLEESGVEMNPPLMADVINRSYEAGRKVLEFYKWAIQQPECKPNADVFNSVVDLFGRRKDFKAVESLLVKNASGDGVEIDQKTFQIVVERLVKAGRGKQAVVFFNKMEEYGFKQDEAALKLVVSTLCERGFASYAENLVKQLADTYYPDELVCNTLVQGWCVAGKLDEARRMVNEMSVGGFAMGVMAYNALLDCVCKLCREKDPFRLLPEANNILIEMEAAGVPRNESTFNILITHLCRIRKTEDAYKLFVKMEEYGCSPNLTTYVVLIRSLYLAARVADGDEMLKKMTEAGFKADVKTYFSFIKVLCGIERAKHALKVFSTMKKNGCRPGREMFELLIPKLCKIGLPGEGKRLWRESCRRRLGLKRDILNQSKTIEKPVEKKKEKPKRESLTVIRKKKDLKLKKIRLSFVKKPKNSMRIGR